MSSFLSKISKGMLFQTSLMAVASTAIAAPINAEVTVHRNDHTRSASRSQNVASRNPEATQQADDLKSLLEFWKKTSEKRDGLIKKIEQIDADFKKQTPTQDRINERNALVKQTRKVIAEQETKRQKLCSALAQSMKTVQKVDEEKTNLSIELAEICLVKDDYEHAYKLLRQISTKGTLPKTENSRKKISFMAFEACSSSDRYEEAKTHLGQAMNQSDRRFEPIMKQMDQRIKLMKDEIEIRRKEAAANDLPRVEMKTTAGTMIIELFENQAPNTVANFVNLVEKGYYNGLTFHRVLPRFMAQGGCPDGTGGGGPGYTIDCECDRKDFRYHFSGTLSMAHAGKNTGGSQFFITFGPTPHLDGKHTAFGRVIEGKEVLSKLTRINPQAPNPAVKPSKIVTAKVIRKRKHDYQPKTTPKK